MRVEKISCNLIAFAMLGLHRIVYNATKSAAMVLEKTRILITILAEFFCYLCVQFQY